MKLFNKFKEEHSEVNMSIGTFVQQNPWHVKPITICDTCCCCYHAEFELYFDTFLDIGKTFWAHSPPPSTLHDFISQILCEREVDELFYQNKVLVERNVIIVEI